MINSTETQFFKSKISILTIPRENFWIFKSGILEIIYILIDSYEKRSNLRYSDNDISSISSDETSNKSSTDASFNDDLQDYHEIKDDGLFFHLAFSVEEVTLMCSTHLINQYLSKAMKLDPKSTLIDDEFFLIQVFSDGSNIGKKILELTQPLSLNNISLFFISNYFSDLVLVPIKDKAKTIEILEEYENEKLEDSKNEISEENSRSKSCSNELEIKTFKLFRDNNIKPVLLDDAKLLLTGARAGDSAEVLKQTAESISRLNTDCIDSKSFPKYFAITRTPTEEIALLLPYNNDELDRLNFSKKKIMGSLQDYYYPIYIDLKKLPIDLKGIVAGMASKLLRLHIDEMSYLSLGKSGIVLIPDMFKEQVEDKLEL